MQISETKRRELRAKFIIPALPPLAIHKPIARRTAFVFVVYCKDHGAMECREGQLYFTPKLTPFLTQKEAVNAIQRTKEERLKDFGREFESDFGALQILRRRIEA